MDGHEHPFRQRAVLSDEKALDSVRGAAAELVQPHSESSITHPVTFSEKHLRTAVMTNRLHRKRIMKTKVLFLWAGLLFGMVHTGGAQPMIIQQPRNQTNVAGTTATFSVAAVGTASLSFQWRSYANAIAFTNIPRADTASLVLNNVQPTSRLFAVVVTDGNGMSTTSSPLVTLTVVFPPVITNQPASQPGIRGYSTTFRVGASGTPPLAYQWYFNATNLWSQTNTSLMLPPVNDLDAGDYFVTVTNLYGAATSQVAQLTVGADSFTRITTGPGGQFGNSAAGAWGDYDNDGFIDLFVPNTGPNLVGSASQFLYHNNGDGTFSRITNGAIAQVQSNGRAGVWGDYDNDGYLDLILVNIDQTNALYLNNGDGSFTQVTNNPVVSDVATSRSVSWIDYDSDGYLDLFRTALNQPRRLYRNNHNGTFTRIIQGSFLTVPGTFLGFAWGDYNNDGRPDLFLPNNGEENRLPDYLFRNDGSGAFSRVGAGILDGNFNGSSAAWGDYDNDGDLDLFVANHYHPPTDAGRPNLLYRNDGNGTFTSLTSVPANDPEYQGGTSFGGTWGDYDNDGWLDLFVANRLAENDFLYHNNRDGTFTKILAGILVNDGAYSQAAAWGDYDNDGFLDLFVGNRGGTNLLYHNNGNDNHWLKFRLIGTRSNRSAIGAKVRVRATINGHSFWQMREIPGGDGLTGQNSLHVHLGLGNATNADLVRIEWPSGAVQEFSNVAAQQFLTVTEPGGEPRLAATREGGELKLTLTGKQGCRYAIEGSTSLPTWDTANLTVTITNQGGAVTFPAPDATNGIHRFYRAIWQ
jgi:hypothetical protein